MNRKINIFLVVLVFGGIVFFSLLSPTASQPSEGDFSSLNFREYPTFYIIDMDELVLEGTFCAREVIGNTRNMTVTSNEVTFQANTVIEESYWIDPVQLDSLPLIGPFEYQPQSIPSNLKVFVEPEGTISFDYTGGDGYPIHMKTWNPNAVHTATIWSAHTPFEPDDPAHYQSTETSPRLGATIVEVLGPETMTIHGEGALEDNGLRLILELRENGFKSIFCASME